MSRAPKQPVIYQDKLNIPIKFLQFATPEEVALYRAEKLRCDKIVELGAGIGGQTIAFSQTCKKVIAIELDKTKVRILEDNLKKLGIKNVEVILGSSLDEKILKKISSEKPNIIFCDTERPEKAERTLDKIKPPIRKIIEKYSEITPKISIEIPPLTKDIDELKEDYEFEKEFISLNKQLNRLTLYFNGLRQEDVSAISLPTREKISYISSKENKTKNKIDEYKYLYIIDPTILASDLLNSLSKKFDSPIIELHKKLLVSNKKINSSFLTEYRILSTCANERDKIIEKLKKLNAKKVVLNYKIDPKDYWKERNFLENNLKGNKEICLFVDEEHKKAILTEKEEN